MEWTIYSAGQAGISCAIRDDIWMNGRKEPSLVISQVRSSTFPKTSRARPWRNNLAAASTKQNYIFVAIDETIEVIEILNASTYCTVKTIERSYKNPADLQGYIDISHPHAVNYLYVGELGKLEVLVAADDCGVVSLWYTNSLQSPPITFQVGGSAWGLATHAKRRLLAVSANPGKIYIYKLGTSVGYGMNNLLTLTGHLSNVPSISFDRTGHFLVSTSIDGEIILWNLDSASVVCRRLLPHSR